MTFVTVKIASRINTLPISLPKSLYASEIFCPYRQAREEHFMLARYDYFKPQMILEASLANDIDSGDECFGG